MKIFTIACVTAYALATEMRYTKATYVLMIAGLLTTALMIWTTSFKELSRSTHLLRRASTNFSSSDVFERPHHEFVNVVDIAKLAADEKPDEFPCPVVGHEGLNFTVCTYRPEADQSSTPVLLGGNIWEADYVSKILRLLQINPRALFVDVGANVGIYALPAALVGAKVIAIEASAPTVRMLARSIHIANLTGRITVLQNALSNEHATLAFGGQEKNPSNSFLLASNSCAGLDASLDCNQTGVKTITLDDLLPLMSDSRECIMKVDIQANEIRAFDERTATRFIEEIDVVVILMEFLLYAPRYPNKAVDRFVEFFYRHYYTVYDPNLQKLGANWGKWPGDILLVKNRRTARST